MVGLPWGPRGKHTKQKAESALLQRERGHQETEGLPSVQVEVPRETANPYAEWSQHTLLQQDLEVAGSEHQPTLSKLRELEA